MSEYPLKSSRLSGLSSHLIVGVVALVMVLWALPGNIAQAADGDPVTFNDANLEQAVKKELSIAADQSVTEGDMRKLTWLIAPDAGIRDISALRYATNLTNLFLDNNQISDMSALSGLHQLTELSAEENRISDVSALSGLTSLTSLTLGHNQISDVRALSRLTKLTHLTLDTNQISDVNALAGLTNLSGLWLYNNKISDVSPLRGLTSLGYLSLSHNQISDISVLANLTNLSHLYLNDNQINDISSVTNLTGLNWLDASNNQIGDISPLRNLRELAFLALNHNQVTDVSALANLNDLETLQLYLNQISDVTPLAGLRELTYLQLSGNKISDVSALANLKNLQELRLSNNDIADVSLLGGLTKLTNVDLSGNGISDFRALSSDVVSDYTWQYIVRDVPHLTSENPSTELSFVFYNPTGAAKAIEPFIPVSGKGLAVTKKDDSTFVVTWDKKTPLDREATYVVAESADGFHKLLVKVSAAISDADKYDLKVPGQKVEVADKANLTDAEKQQVADAVKRANGGTIPGGGTLAIGTDGTATVTYPDGSKDTIAGSELVVQKVDPGDGNNDGGASPMSPSPDPQPSQESGKLARTGVSGLLGLGFASAVLLIGGGSALLLQRRKLN